MRPKFNYRINGLAGIVILLSSMSLARAQGQHPTFMAPDFNFDQIDSICVMPLIDARKDATHVDLSGLRPELMSAIQDKGYRLVDPSCSRDADAIAAPAAKARWILTVRLDDFEVSKAAPSLAMGSFLTASLFDAQSAKEVWRDTAKTGFGGRLVSSLLGSSFTGAVESGFGSVLSKFERRKKPSPPSQADAWAPMALPVRLAKGHSFSSPCNGFLRLDSGNLSFEQFSNGKNAEKCAGYEFSLPGARVKSNRLVWMISVPGKGNLVLQQPDEAKATYLFLALQNLQ
ncbi:MAG: hypothetical protein WAL45_17595 [Terracidiphilus sp.]